MSLQEHIRAFTNEDTGYIRANGTKIAIGGGINVGMACHNATFMWLYHAAHGAFPSLDDMGGGVTQQFVNDLIRYGNATRVTMGQGPLPNDVLIFADPDAPLVGRHSCAVIGNGRLIAGYNQVGWFDGGISHDYSEHAVDSFDWVARSCCWSTPRRATTSSGQHYVWAVRGETAIGHVQ